MRYRPSALVGIAVSLLAAGCGAAGRSPGVASVGSPATTVTRTATTTTQGGTVGGRHGGVRQMAIDVGSGPQGVKFSSCMRKHGEPGFSDPDSQGAIQARIDPSSPTFRSALSTCEKLLPSGSLAPTPAQEAQRQLEMLGFSKCMRSHGIKDFPDPANGGQLELNGGSDSDLDPGNPQFRRAETACRSHLPPGGEKELPGSGG